jgi:rhodanese-related sulfurtransferase
MAMKRDTIVGVFHDATQAQQAIQALKRAGFSDEQIGVMGRHHDEEMHGKNEEGESFAEEGAMTGLATGAGLGALWGLGIMAGVLPGIGPAIAGGTLGVLLSSAAAGAAAAGIAGALIGLGIPEEEADFYEGEFKSGRTLVTVKTGGRHADAVAILTKHGAYDADTRERMPDAMSAGGHLAPTQSDEGNRTIEMPVRAEDVVVENQLNPEGQPARGGDMRMPVDAEDVRIGDHGDVIISREKKHG